MAQAIKDLFPGPIGPGRIEARETLFPSASSAYFPAQLGRAALKQRMVSYRLLPSKAFPGPIGPGRIEASASPRIR